MRGIFGMRWFKLLRWYAAESALRCSLLRWALSVIKEL